MSAVVVQARYDSETLDRVDSWQVRKGDFGVLRWKPHRRHPRFLEPYVVWDSDPKRKLRKIILSSITIVGLQTPTARFLLFPSVD